MNDKSSNTTDFGFESVPIMEKAARVRDVFQSVAGKYDLMNDLMSFGVHRLWKHSAISACALRQGQTVLDLAGGTGDLTAKISAAIGDSGKVILTDINQAMMEVGKSRLLDKGIFKNVAFVQADAEHLPFKENCFDCVIIGFGLRNVTNKDQALNSMFRVLKPGGRAIILEFSKPTLPLLEKIYDTYSFQLLPKIGKFIAKDEDSYRYLAESIRKHPDQETLLMMLQTAGFEDCDYQNLSQGIVALHKGYKY